MTHAETATTAERLVQLARGLLDQPDFAAVVASLQAGHAATLGGVWGSSRALVAAALAGALSGPVVVVCPHPAEIDDVSGDLAVFGCDEVLRFPAWESAPGEQALHDEIYGDRLGLLKQLSGGVLSRLVVTSIQSLLQPVPTRQAILDATRLLRVGATLDGEQVTSWLIDRGYHASSAVELPGEFARRGGILDVFAADWEQPVRIELFGDEVESLRRFSVQTQRSLESLDEIEITALPRGEHDQAHLVEHLPRETCFLLIEPHELEQEGRHYVERLDRPQDVHSVASTLAKIYEYPSVTASGVPSGSAETTCHLQIESIERFSGDVHRVREELDQVANGLEVIIVCETQAESQRLAELLNSTRLASEGRLQFAAGRLNGGFRLIAADTMIISGGELFARDDLTRRTKRRLGRVIDSFLELREGDLVVHLAHGIGRYRGMTVLDKDGSIEEHLELEFHGGTKIYVPASKIELVQKYVGARKACPQLARVGGRNWVRQKKAAEDAVSDLAAELIDLQAQRRSRPGLTFPEDTQWQQEFDASFPYQETPDQLTAIAAIKRDMQRARPMDRLLCGDVGYGKTELAIRATFKAVDAGYQVAVLVPTTILAEQHLRTFRGRLAEFPFEIASLSRFSTKKEQAETVRRAAEGSVDIVIGTHRLAQGDVEFANLGLLIIDEEQRFGVAIKERLKALRATVDVLTMSATPIPRTLHMSLLGIRDISNLETPPEDRLAVETRVARFDEDLIRHAILRELNRDGQVFFVHNRVQDIELVAARLARIVPEAKIEIAHGQMPEQQLEDVMIRFVQRQTDVLLSTTIIESGLDIPNANTMFIHQPDRYGLADLHQLRGRVGRYKHRAYCYLVIEENRQLTPEAARRLRAIEEFSQMGAGFALSMRDLELRGAGNLLGTQQSGHIATVGYELYCTLLENVVRQSQHLPPKEMVDVNLDLPGAAYLPASYVPELRIKIDLYRRLARLTRLDQLTELRDELSDRFGPLPAVADQMLNLVEIRILAHQAKVRTIHTEDKYVVLGFVSPSATQQIARASGGKLRVVDKKTAYLPAGKELIENGGVLPLVKSLLQPS